MYFKTLPKMGYPWKDKNKKQHSALTPDIFRRVHIDKYFKNRNNLLSLYVQDNETPEILAHNYYGNSKYHWIILLANNIVDIRKEWPMGSRDLTAYIDQKYGINNGSSVHHYVEAVDDTIIVDWDQTRLSNAEIKAVTNREYEEDRNERKRQIFLLDKAFLKDIVTQYKKLVK